MKTNFSKLPREEIEARITTMLLGEMPADEAAELRDYISQDTELQKLHDDLKQTISLVTEASAQEQPQQLSAGRREALLESFKMVRPAELTPKPERESAWRTWAALAAMIVFLLAVSVLISPSLTKSRSSGKSVVQYRGGEENEIDGKISVTGAVLGNEDFEKFTSSNSRGDGGERGRATLKSSPASEAKLMAQRGVDRLNEQLAEAPKVASRAANFPKAPTQPTKIELPAATEPETRLGQNAQESNWAMQGGQTRGFGFGGAFADAEGKNQSITKGGTLPTDQFVAGKDLSLAYGVTPTAPAAQSPQFSANTIAPSGRFDSLASVDAKKDGSTNLKREPEAIGLLVTGNEPQGVAAAIDPVTGLPTASTFAMTGRVDPATGLPVAATNMVVRAGEEVSQIGEASQMGMGGMGGGANMSMMYYMSNPELMKRYFPQMYSMMQKGKQAGGVGGAEGANAGMPGLAGAKVESDRLDSLGRRPSYIPPPAMTPPPILGGVYSRYRGQGAPLDVPATPKPEQQVALGKELKSVTEQNEADVSKKSNLAASAEKNGLVVLADADTAAVTEQLERPLAAPAERLTSRTDSFQNERIAESAKVQDARSLIENGRLQEAEKLLGEVVKTDPDHRAASYYLNLVKEQKNSQEARKREIAAKDGLINVEKSWNEKLGRAAADEPVSKPKAPIAIPQPEVSTAENAFSTFSLNVSDVSFKLAAASLEKGVMPEAATVRSEEFINAFDYRDPEPQGAPIGFIWERARYPFAQDRDLLRFSVKTAASGRQAGKPLNIVLLLDSSGSMERADRVRILNECLKTLATQLRPEDRISVVAFARTARLWVDGLPGNQANELTQRVGNLNPEGGTNLEEAMKVAYETARKHFTAEGVNRVVLLTDGAANLGDVEPESLKRKVEIERKKGIALDCFGIGWEGLNDELLEALSRNGDGRYGFVNTPEAAASEFAGQLAGALQVAASDVKVQVEWNPKRVTAYRQIGYAKHQLTKEQFRDNTVDAAEIGAAEAGNALYTVQVDAAGEGPLGTVRVRFKVPGTSDYREHAWPLNYDGAPKPLENSSYPLRLAGTASAFSEWLVSSPYAIEVTTDRLLSILSGIPEHFAPDPRPKKLEWMIRQAKSLAGK